GAYLEDRSPDISDGRVQIVDGAVDALTDLVTDDHRRGRLQLKAGREQPLNHHIVKVPSNAFAILEHHQLLPFVLRADPFKRERGLRGERRDHADVRVGIEPLALDVQRDGQDAWAAAGGREGRQRRAAAAGRSRPRGGGAEVVDDDVTAARQNFGERRGGGRNHRAGKLVRRTGDNVDAQLVRAVVVVQ